MAKMSPAVPAGRHRVQAQPAVHLDAIDRRILDLLSADGRASVREVAERARIGRATAYSRIQRLAGHRASSVASRSCSIPGVPAPASPPTCT